MDKPVSPVLPAPATHAPADSWGRWAMGAVLAGLLVGATFCHEELYALFTPWSQRLLEALGLAKQLPALQQGPITQVMDNPHSVPPILLYSVLYLAICGALLLLLLPLPAQRRLVFKFYGLAGLALVLLVLGGRVAHSASLLQLGKQLVHFIVSPLPVIVLVPLLRWHLPLAKPAA
ncbi:hypothetical protein HHL22_02795 [Hymenobacter sp. RP-2-7]|uniref:Uncharacterized protein n=1 Tax=Hymenobacter polaris TaxID=2682546 RepID=A0A7Y0FL85_9BACT|nr:hypothetical protein [Hymenobacter polaris]NML64124.1 hypothetical protein [Hymenobacter polaris]